MSLLSNIRKFGALLWGAVTYVLEIMPRLMAALDALNMTEWKEKMLAALQGGGMAADDYVEVHEPAIRHGARVFRAIGNWAFSRADLLDEIADEGVRIRAPGEADAMTPEVLADFFRRVLNIDNVDEIKAVIEQATPTLRLAAAASPRQDVSRSPTLNC